MGTPGIVTVSYKSTDISVMRDQRLALHSVKDDWQ